MAESIAGGGAEASGSIALIAGNISSDLTQTILDLQGIVLELQGSAIAEHAPTTPAFANWTITLQTAAVALQKHALQLKEMVDPVRSVLRPERFYQAGMVAKADERFELAARFFRRALELRAEYPEAHKGLGDTLREQGAHEEAIKHYRRAAEIQESLAHPLENQGLGELRDARRIAIVCQPWDNVASESSNSIVVIAYQLARCLASDWHVTIYGRRKAGQKSREIDSETMEFRHLTIHRPHQIIEKFLSVLACYKKRRINYMLSTWYHLFYALRVALSIRASKCDVVFVHNFLQFASVIKLFNPSTTICLGMQSEWLTQFATATNERRLSTVDLITGCSDYITEGIKTRFSTVAARCHTVYNGVDSDRFRPTSDVPEPNGRPARLLFVGRLSPEKGVHVLIQAFKILAKSRPTLRLDLVGGASAQPYLYLAPDPNDPAMASLEPFYGNRLSEMVQRQVMQRQLILKGQPYLDDLVAQKAGDERIVFHGPVLQTETIDFYRRATVLVFPSVWHEPFGIPIVEAMACGLPVISTCSGGIPEIVEHGQTGMLVARGDAEQLALAISQVIDDPVCARAMGEAGRQRVLERFTWEASARRLADLIESVPRNVDPCPRSTRRG